MRAPSGDQRGLSSGPSCVTSGRTDASATVTIEMSAVPLLCASGLTRWSKAICLPSGDHENRPTVNAPFVRRRDSFDATSSTYSCDI